MNRLSLYLGIIVCFLLVTATSFVFGKFVLGDRVFNKPNLPVTHLPGDSSAAQNSALAKNTEGVAGPRAPSVVIKLRLQPGGVVVQDDNESTPPIESGSPATPVSSEAQPKPAVRTPRRERDRTLPPPVSGEAEPGEVAGPVRPTPYREAAKARAAEPTMPRTKPVGAPDDPAPATKPARGNRVQVGLFDGKENAELRAAELQKLGHRVTTTIEEQDGKRVYRVQVGPFKSRDAAAKAKTSLSSQGFEGFVPQ